MRDVAIDYAVAAALMHLEDVGSFDTVHSVTIASLTARLRSSINAAFDEERVTKIVRAVERLGIGEFYEDPFPTPIFQISNAAISSFFRSRASNVNVYIRGRNLGLDWLKTAFENEKYWIEFDSEPQQLAGIDIPIGNELVSFDHNSAPFVEASELIDKLLEHLKTGNDVGNLTVKDVDKAIAEVASIKTDLQHDSVDARKFMEQAKSTLSWISKQGASAVIGALAISALLALAKLIAVPF